MPPHSPSLGAAALGMFRRLRLLGEMREIRRRFRRHDIRIGLEFLCQLYRRYALLLHFFGANFIGVGEGEVFEPGLCRENEGPMYSE